MPRDKERIERIRDHLKKSEMDAIVCALPMNVLLLTGYWPIVGTAIAIVTREGQSIILAPSDEKELADAAGADEVRTFETGSLDEMRSPIDAVRRPLRTAVRDLGLERGRVGYEGGVYHEPVSYASINLYGEALCELLEDLLSSGSVESANELLTSLRSTKTPHEIGRIRRACEIAEVAFTTGYGHLETGLKETGLAALFEAPLSTYGIGYAGVARAGGFVFCMSGGNSASAHGAYARSRDRAIEPGDFALVHCNSYADGYWTDITRTYILGRSDRKKAGMYDAVFEARQAALDSIRPGEKASAVDAAARGVLRKCGFGAAFKHPAGHGVGFAAIDHNAQPRLHPKSRDILESGMVFNVEPAIYIDGVGGLRHCDMVAVTEAGCEVLTSFQSTADEMSVVRETPKTLGAGYATGNATNYRV